MDGCNEWTDGQAGAGAGGGAPGMGTRRELPMETG